LILDFYFYFLFFHNLSIFYNSFAKFLSFPYATPTGNLLIGYFSIFFFIFLSIFGIDRIQLGTLQPDACNKLAKLLTTGLSYSVKKVIAFPDLSALPVLPTLWIYVSIELGKS
jgi:hypothetical protein